MGITLNTILQFTGSDRVLLNAQGTGLVSVNRLQRFKSFFNIGDARQKNAETLTAIHHAVLNDPRFASKELQDQAVRLLSEVRVDRALDATREQQSATLSCDGFPACRLALAPLETLVVEQSPPHAKPTGSKEDGENRKL